MSIYLILDNQIHDVEAYERYKTAVKPMVEAAGGEYLTRDGKVDVRVGDWNLQMRIWKPTKEVNS